MTLRDVRVVDHAPTTERLQDEVIAGLRAPRKTLPCKLFYDAVGSALFDRICELPEYYPTRTEIEIFERSIAEMADAIGEDALLIEFGSGSGVKTRLLLDALHGPAGYVAIDIARQALIDSTRELARTFPSLPIQAVCADYTRSIELDWSAAPHRRRIVFFPGSTIGNFEPPAVESFLSSVVGLVGARGGALIGVDLAKDPAILIPAYDDAEGVTAAFNKNVLVHVNRALGATFIPALFEHRVAFDAERSRIEMHLVATIAHTVRVAGAPIHFAAGESIHTENSYKWRLAEFTRLAERAGLAAERVWTDPRGWFAEILFSVRAGA